MQSYLNPIPPHLRARATERLEAGDAIGFLGTTTNEYALNLVARHRCELLDRGMYEEALLHAWAITRVNHKHWPLADLRDLFLLADRERLRSLSPPPGKGPFTLYRGVAGVGAARRVRGLSWTASLERATWFAKRFACLPNPAAFTVQARDSDVLAYIHDRQEEEYVVLLPADAKPRRVP